MTRISYNTLHCLIANIDYVFKDSYPIKFRVTNNNGYKTYECGITSKENQYLKDLETGEILSLQDPDWVSFKEIDTILSNKCNINNDSIIYFYKQ